MFTFVVTKEQILKEKALEKGYYVTEPLVVNEEGYNQPLLHVNGVKKVDKAVIELKIVFNITKALNENGHQLVHPNGGNAWGHKFISITPESCLFKAAEAWYLVNRQFFENKGAWKSLNLTAQTYKQGARLGHIIADYYVITMPSLEFQTSKDGWQFLPIEKIYVDERLEPKLVYRGCGMKADPLSSGFEDYTQVLAQEYNIKLPTLMNEKNMG